MRRRHFLATGSLGLSFAGSGFAASSSPAKEAPADSMEARRAEILRWFEANVYGHPPLGIRSELTWKPAAEPRPAPDVIAEDGTLSLTGAGGRQMQVPVKLFRPAHSEEPVPAAIFICNRPHDEMEFKQGAEFWPADAIVKAGWLTVAFNVKDVAHDEPAVMLKNPGLLDLDTSPPGESRGAATSAWAFVASEIRAHLCRRTDVLAEGISVVGHSRGGKAAVLAGARDPEFAVTFSSNSGCGGAAHNLTKEGEKIADITKRFPTWFCEKFRSFAGKEAELRYDQHHLLGCIAHRKIFVTSASEDAWADPRAEYFSCQLASPIHQFVGAEGLTGETLPLPEPGEVRPGGSIGYHLRQGKHDLTRSDWLHFLEFAKPATR